MPPKIVNHFPHYKIHENPVDVGLRPPKLYNVLVLNDDYTPMDFVVELLMRVFSKNDVEATELMMSIHRLGQQVVGIYSFDIAVTKKTLATKMAEDAGFPLQIEVRE